MPQFAGAPSMGGNFSYDPFAPARRQQPQQVAAAAPRRDGFSEDGLSYSVINDFDKLAAQALAEYDAALAHERQKGLSIDSRGIVTAKPVNDYVAQNLYRQIVEPINILTGQPSKYGSSSPENRVFDVGGKLVQWNPSTGTAEVVWGGGTKNISLTPEQKSSLGLIESDIVATRKLADKEEDFDKKNAYQNRLVTLERNRRKLFEQPVASPPMTETLAAPQVPAPTPRGFIGTPGGVNQFSGQPIAPQSQDQGFVGTEFPTARGPLTTTPSENGSRFSITTVSDGGTEEVGRAPMLRSGYDFPVPTQETSVLSRPTALGTPPITSPEFWKSSGAGLVRTLNAASEAITPDYNKPKPQAPQMSFDPLPITTSENRIRLEQLARLIQSTPMSDPKRDSLVREYVRLSGGRLSSPSRSGASILSR